MTHSDEYLGAIVTFIPNPQECVEDHVMTTQCRRFAGEVIKASAKEPFGPGRIPDVALRVRGRTGRTVDISVVEHYVRVHGGWKEAMEAVKP